MKFSEKLRLLIDEFDITQKQFANDLNIAPSTIGGYVQGVSEPDFETLKRIALYFNVSADYLLGIQENKTNSLAEVELLRVFRSMENKTNSLAEVELLRVFRSMTNEQQQLFIEQGKVFTKANNKLKARKMTKSS
ncbi:helix-turn-helix domain-containing protein [Ruminococcus bromii]|nr:helix-turn-helix domain-containing protein [Ruminococcus bromii]